MEEAPEDMNSEEKLSGFIFMCNRITKPECYRYRVFGLPAGKREVVEKIKPGTYLFLFDTDLKLLYGTYMATSRGKLRIQPLAFGQKFPAQVSFKIFKDSMPLPEKCFKHAIQDNYQKDSNRFKPELNIRQVRNLLSLFRPLPGFSTAPTHPVLEKICSTSSTSHPPVNNAFHPISRSPLEEAILSRLSQNQISRQLNYNHVNEPKHSAGYSNLANNMLPNSVAAESVPLPPQASTYQLNPPTSSLSSEGTYAPGTGSTYTPLPGPQYSHQNIPISQPECHPSLVANRGSVHAPPLQDPQPAHQNILHSQPEVHSSMMTTSSIHAQSVEVPQHPYQSYLQPTPEFHSSAVNVSNNHAQMMQDPHHTHQNILNLQPDTHSAMANVGGSSYPQSLPDPQYTHQNPPILQPDYNSSLVNMGHANGYDSSLVSTGHTHAMTQSQTYASSSYYYPYTPQGVAYDYGTHQGYGAIQGVVSSDQQVGMGNVYYQSQPSMQTQENVVNHSMYSENSNS